MIRFDPEVALEKLRGKRLMFVGDSLQRGQWQSFVCLVEFIIPADSKSMRRGRVHSTFRAKVQLINCFFQVSTNPAKFDTSQFLSHILSKCAPSNCLNTAY